MSDRVGYPVGNTKGRDHIYWPVISPAFAASEGLPSRALGVNLATMMALAWRVKKWRVAIGGVSGSLHEVFPEGSPGPPETDETILTAFTPNIFDIETGATREAGLLSDFFLTFGSGSKGGLRNGGMIGTSAPGTVSETTTLTFTSSPPESFDPPSGTESGTFSSPGGATVAMQVGDSESTGGFNGVYYDSGPKLFYPEIKFLTTIALHFGGQFTLSGDMRDLSGTDGLFTVNPVVAPSFQIPLMASGIIDPFRGHSIGPTDVSGSVAATMTAIEFWPYKNSAGDPVYNVDTGAQLVDPFT